MISNEHEGACSVWNRVPEKTMLVSITTTSFKILKFLMNRSRGVVDREREWTILNEAVGDVLAQLDVGLAI